MNPQWNTPPNGDFASYVERLSAQAALARRAPAESEHALDAGMAPSAASSGRVPDSAWGRSVPSGGGSAASGVADAVRRLAVTLAQGWRAWAEEVARQQAQQKQQRGRKK